MCALQTVLLRESSPSIKGLTEFYLLLLIDTLRAMLATMFVQGPVRLAVAFCSILAPKGVTFYLSSVVPELENVEIGVALRASPLGGAAVIKPGMVSLNIGTFNEP